MTGYVKEEFSTGVGPISANLPAFLLSESSVLCINVRHYVPFMFILSDHCLP